MNQTTNHGCPIYLMGDECVEKVRDWRDMVNKLKIYRAKGYAK